MRHSIQLRSTVFFIAIAILSVPLHAFVVPWVTSHPGTPQQSSNDQSTYKLRNILPQLTWIRDTAIEKVFGTPPRSRKSTPQTSQPESKSDLPNKLLAKYGGDVVLRFNLTTSEEEKALAEAADTLFLDVWAFTNNWADIRLREDDVSRGAIVL